MKKALVTLCRIVLGVVFLVACVPKIFAPADFALVLFRYQMVPHAWINLLALFLPWLELIAALALLFSRSFREAAILLTLGLLVVFTSALGINLYRGINVACGCFSVNLEASHMGWMNMARNGVLMIMAWVVYLIERRGGMASTPSKKK